MYKFLITGANFENKGAESMLYIAVDEIKQRFPDAQVYYAGYDKFDERKFCFKEMFYTETSKSIALGGCEGLILSAKIFLKNCLKTVLRRGENRWREFDLQKEIKTFTAIIDVSGFNLGEKWNIHIQESFLNNIRLAKKYSIPVYLMPQSFGPFNYPDDKKYLLNEIRTLLPYPKVIFAREKEGKSMLEDTFDLNNVVLSTDLVLQNGGIHFENVFRKKPEFNLPAIAEKNNVAIIPNKQCFNFGDRKAILKLYEQIIDKLLSASKNIYLFRHSSEDLEFCHLIKDRFTGNEKVVVLDNDLSCLEYDSFVKNFDFIVCSRFHGIVHAYRNGIPCIALGWAMKYKELAENVSQGQFVFNIADDIVDAKRLDSIVSHMLENYKIESETIRKKVAEIQKANCFSVLEELK